MKRLVDESTDELTRSLLVAGIEHQPPSGNRGRVMLALGAGGALGLFSSNAFAWLGTTAGKVTAASVVVGIAGAALVIVPRLQPDAANLALDGVRAVPHATRLDGSRVTAQLRPPSEPGAGERGSDGPRLDSPERAGLAPIDDPAAPSEAVAPSTTASSGDGRGTLVRDTGEQNVAEPLQGAEERSATAGPTQKAATARSRAKRWGVGKKLAVSKPNAATRDEGPTAQAASSGGGAVGLSEAAGPDLEAEVRLVDDMHWAVRHDDDDALARFLERYRLTFPDGQLQKEVAQFAARLPQSDRAQSDRARGEAPRAE